MITAILAIFGIILIILIFFIWWSDGVEEKENIRNYEKGREKINDYFCGKAKEGSYV